MENIWLFLVTTCVYLAVIHYLNKHSCIKYGYNWYFSWKKLARQMALAALLALPLNINGNIITIAGNATAEKNIFSLFSFYQKAKHNTVSLFGAVYQQAENNAGVLIGLAGYQRATNNAIIIMGLAGYQRAELKADSILAITLYQRVGEKTRAFGALSSLLKD